MSQPAMQTLSNSQTASSQSSQELNLTSIANLIAEVRFLLVIIAIEFDV